MARHKTSPLEDVIEVTSKFPWWVGLLLALGSYIVLHMLAIRPPPTATGIGQMGAVVTTTLVTTLAMFGQIILPFAFTLAALMSFIASNRAKRLYTAVASRPVVASLNDLTWSEFEELVGEHFHRLGFQVSREGGNGPDGGIDLTLRKGSELYLVQCKQWRAYKVGVPQIREFYGVMAARGAVGGYFVTSGVYTDEAKAFAHGTNIKLIDGKRLSDLISLSQKNPSAPMKKQQPITSPLCPSCNSEMVRRVAREGENPGREFWGCVKFPKCKGVRNI